MPQPPWLSPSRRSSRSLRALLRLAPLLVVAVLVSPAGHAGKGPVPKFLSAAFAQVNWLEAPSVPIQANSNWGVMSFAYEPVAKTWYLNANIRLPGGRNEHWFLRNLPLFGERNPRLRRKAVFLDLRRLGIAEGQDLKSVQAIFSLDLAPRKNAPPVGSGSILPVGDRELLLDSALGPVKVEPFLPGSPRPILVTRPPKEDAAARSPNRVQEAKGHGVAGGIARSLDWLNQTFQWDPTLTAQEIYDDLVNEGVSSRGDVNGNGTPLDEWIEAKDDYSHSLSVGKVATTVWDGANLLPPMSGIAEANGDLLKWLKPEMTKGSDVELLVSFSGGRHAFMLTGMFTDQGKTYVRFRFDDKPGDALRGDEDEVVGEVFKGADGNYYLLSDKWRIVGGISEAVKR